MNSIEKLKTRIEAASPGTLCTMDAPPATASSRAQWFLDCRRGDQHVVVEWRPGQGFGLATTDDSGFNSVDEIFPEAQDRQALDRVLDLLQGPRPGTVRALRENRGVTQSELAMRLGISEPALSQLEERDDLELSTLRRLVAGLGGTLNVEVRFPDGAEARLDVGK